ncbi:MAG: hypothetical protein H8E15_17975 [Planctomycetes bacterium]|nr:hypothetical protein [Planctomycetota bacterium]
MAFLLDLWLPIMAAAALVFVASSVLHMLIPIHRNDYSQIPGEDEVLDAMRKANLGRGSYMFPFASCMKDMQSEEITAKLNSGPVGFMTVLPPGPMQMGKSLGQWFLFTIGVSVLIAYATSLVFEAGADYRQIFRFTATLGFLGYSFGYVQDAIWKGQRWSVVMKFMFDGLVYALVTAGTFGWLWPEA